MDEENAMPIPEGTIGEIPASGIQEESPEQSSVKKVQGPIPRHQNKMVAETTSDMFMSGLMCE